MKIFSFVKRLHYFTKETVLMIKHAARFHLDLSSSHLTHIYSRPRASRLRCFTAHRTSNSRVPVATHRLFALA